MRTPLLGLVGLGLFAAASGCQTPPSAPDDPATRNAGWRSDLAFLDSAVVHHHPPVASDPGFAAFHAAIAQLSAGVPSMSDEAIGAGIQRILVAIGDGHTTIIPDDVGPIAFLALKVDFYWFDDGVYIVSVRPGLGAWQGARVTAVGGMPIDEFIQRIAPYVPHDNSQSRRWLGAQLMQYTSVIRAAGATASDASTSLSLEYPAGGTGTVNVAAWDRAALPRLHPPGGETGATPWYLRNLASAWWIDSLPGDRTLYVNFNSVRDEPGESLAAFAARVGALLQGGAFDNVIVDVRLNNGGDNTLLAPLLATLDAFDEASATHRIFVITGRATFSAGQNFVTRLEAMTRAVFVGEATGGRPNHIGDQSDIPLPYSGLHVSIASTVYQDAGPGDQRESLEPDIVVPVLSSDYFENRDPALAATLSAIRGAPGGASSVSGAAARRARPGAGVP